MLSTKTAAVLAVVALTATAGGASAATKPKSAPKKHSRTLTLTYTSAGVTTHSLTGVGSMQSCPPAGFNNCLTFSTGRDEKYISISAKDGTGQPVGISFYPGGGSGVSTESFVCGSATNVDIASGTDWSLSPDSATVDPACPGVATQGTVTVVLSNRP
jgi:hypothetical protein